MAEENTPESGASTPDTDPRSSAEEPRPLTLDASEPPAVSEGGALPPVAAPSAAASPSAAVAASADEARAAPSGKPAALTPGQRLAAKKAQKAVEKREFKEELRRDEDEKRQKEEAEADRLLGRTRPQPALPAEVEQAARTFSDFLQDHREKILFTAAGLVALAAIVFGAQRFLRSGAAEHAAQLGSALEIANAAIDADDADGKADDGKPVFKTEQDRATKALAAFDDVIKGSDDAAAAVWAKLGAAVQLVELGKFDDARQRFQRVYDDNTKDAPIAARALEGVGIALEAAGKPDDALKVFDKLKAIEGSAELSEFHSARIKLAKGDREAGKTALKALYDKLSTPAEGSAPSRYLKAEVEVRLAEIDAKLVDKGGVGEAPQQFSEEQIQRLMEQLQKQQGGQAPGTGTE